MHACVLVWQLKKKEDLILQNGKYLPKIADYDLFRSIGKGSFAEVFVGKKQEGWRDVCDD